MHEEISKETVLHQSQRRRRRTGGSTDEVIIALSYALRNLSIRHAIRDLGLFSPYRNREKWGTDDAPSTELRIL